MNNNRIFYRTNDKLEEMDAIDILKLAIEMEVKEKHRYDKLQTSIKDEKIQTQIRRICIEEEKHLKLLQQIYFEMTDHFMDTAYCEDLSHERLKDSIKYCIDKELELVKLYVRLQNLIPIPMVKGILYEIISDEQKHASRMISIYGSQNNNSVSDGLSRMPVAASIKPIKSKNDQIEVDLRIPVISGIVNQSIGQLINRQVENDILEFKNQMEVAAKEGSTQAKEQGRPFVPYIASNNYAVTYDKNNILSISIIYHEYVGGRNAFIRTSYNFDIKTGKSLGLRDIFKPGVQYRELINEEIRRQIKANPSIYPKDTEKTFKGISVDQPYYLEGENIVIYFGFNQISPTVSEIPVIRIPIARFKEQLKSEYFG